MKNTFKNTLLAASVAGAFSLNAFAQSLAEDTDQVVAPSSELTIDEAWSLLATQYPGFAGYYRNKDELVVQIAEVRSRAAGTKLPELYAQLGKQQLTQKISTANVKYGFDELYRWHFALVDLMNDTRFNVYSLDIDEVNNVIALTTDSSSKAQLKELRAAATLSGVPIDAIAIRVGQQPTTTVGLRDRVNPSPGGVQLDYVKNTAPGGSYVCSLGLNVKRGADIGFITAQHCQGKNGQVFNQGGTRIGASIAVGPAILTGCPSGATCKYSDALFAKYDTRNFAARQAIAYAPNLNNIEGNLNVISALSTPAVGTGVWKTGRTTGSTQSTVEQTCTRLKYASYPVTFLCVNKVNTIGNAFARGGDSGGPVWIVSGGNNVSFTGLVSGSGELAIGGVTLAGHGYYSPFSSIQKDLGTLTIAY
jgi:hypothetical protein